jgi:hypothetical protein
MLVYRVAMTGAPKSQNYAVRGETTMKKMPSRILQRANAGRMPRPRKKARKSARKLRRALQHDPNSPEWTFKVRSTARGLGFKNLGRKWSAGPFNGSYV